ncbi:uncharacterized protein SAPINGB_P005580 [Magnusiomyces paraingens]|uniref:Uncharacterized protein n=1 Tax=Magnusiomyces paraingens TaxID=2606893 RepID=A0A5E8C1G5_9ASCO|nr:uncharacterized protein SAPINGB_P005580 [Saprochaete ingens]VVT57192.1 unnamed protein product [Saprochaete ingens]
MHFSIVYRVFILVASVVTAKIISKSNFCSQQDIYGNDFSGVIVQHQYTVDYPPQNHLRVTRCHKGKDRPYDAFLPLPQSQDIKWGQKFCTGNKDKKAVCYILARHKTTSRRVVSLYPAGEWVGGIFLCPGHLLDDGEPCVNENAVPLWPLVASKFAHFEEIHISSTLTRAPILVSADPSDPTNNIPVNWANFIDVYEEYVYQYGSWEPQRMMGDLAINTFRSVSDMAKSPFFPRTNRVYFDPGDYRPRRLVRVLEPRRLPEEDPDNFDRRLSSAYFDLPTLDGDDYKKALISITSTQNNDNKKDKKIELPITMGSLVQLSYHVPRSIFDNLLQAIYTYNSVETAALNVNDSKYQHPAPFRNPSISLDQITLQS